MTTELDFTRVTCLLVLFKRFFEYYANSFTVIASSYGIIVTFYFTKGGITSAHRNRLKLIPVAVLRRGATGVQKRGLRTVVCNSW